MEDLGEQLYDIVKLAHPELAPKLTGMLLQLGEEECCACLDDHELLAMRLDEAMSILDEAGGAKAPPLPPLERRVDPADGKERTLEELRKLCRGTYSDREIDEYWEEMRPREAPTAASAGRGEPAAARPTASAAARAPAAALAPPAPLPSARAGGGQAAPAPRVRVEEALPGLTVWLAELQLSAYHEAASAWIDEQGACSLEEIVENLDDFADGLELKPLERARLEKGAEDAAIVAEEAALEAEAAAASEVAAEAQAQAAEAAFPPLPAKAHCGGEARGAPAEPVEEFPSLAAMGVKKGKRR
eukprot:TRINITY_DN29649_c0_g1_i1.p1 TRINITY_DN29649_c0_g1~~TRINITY_DN29649_c0_g1_i1.p1  ORF type:complete len:355 (+),score=112.31 TRINITY_DN29649_c0_g1_i1:160-1065(+)